MPVSPDRIARARAFRKALTPHEARLWVRLRGLRKFGYHFRRQAPFRGWYLDFVCFDRRLVVELDGVQHGEEEHARRDRVRDAVLAEQGFRTLRFWNADVNTDVEGVVERIVAALSERSPTRPLRGHPPHEGEGGRTDG